MNVSWTIAAAGLTGIVVGAAGVDAARGQSTPRAYIVAEVQVSDSVAYRPYVQQAGPIALKYGGHFIARAGKTEAIEGAPPAGRVAIIEFPSLSALERFESSPEYEAVRPIRRRAATSRIFAVEGVAP